MSEQDAISGWYLPQEALPDLSYTPGPNDPIARFTEEQRQLYGYQPEYLTADDISQLYNYETQIGSLESQLQSMSPSDYGLPQDTSPFSPGTWQAPEYQDYWSALADLTSQISGLESEMDNYYKQAYSRAFGEDYPAQAANQYSFGLGLGADVPEYLQNLNTLKNDYTTWKDYRSFAETGEFPGMEGSSKIFPSLSSEQLASAFPEYDFSNPNDRVRFLADNPTSGTYFGEGFLIPKTESERIQLMARYPGYAGYDWQGMVNVGGTPYTSALIGYSPETYEPEVLWGKRYDPPDSDWTDFVPGLITAGMSAINPLLGAFTAGGLTAAGGGDLKDIAQAAGIAGIGGWAGGKLGGLTSDYLSQAGVPEFLTQALASTASAGVKQALSTGDLGKDDLLDLLSGSLKGQLFGLGKEYLQNTLSGKGTTMNIFGQQDQEGSGGLMGAFSVPEAANTGGFNPTASGMPNLNDMILNDAASRGQLIGGTIDQLYGMYSQNEMAKEAQKARSRMAQERDRAARMADPMMDERAFYQNQLRQLYENPDMITQMPGYDFRYQQGLQALERQLAKGGYLGSGNRAAEVMNYGQGLASTEYQNEINRLYDIISGSFGGAQQAANIYANYSPQLAELMLAEQQSRLRRNQAGLTAGRGLYDIYQSYFGGDNEGTN